MIWYGILDASPAIPGLVILWRRRQPVAPFLALAVAVTFAAAITFGVQRYRLPFDVGAARSSPRSPRPRGRTGGPSPIAPRAHDRRPRSDRATHRRRHDERTTRCSSTTLDAERFGHPGYLGWFYRDNPRGEVIDENEDDEHGERIAHYAVIPTAYRTPTGATPFIFSSNVATSPTVRRGGLFRAMAERVYERARATGAPGMVGVGNDNSTIVVVERFGWHALGPLPVRVCAAASRARPRGRVPTRRRRSCSRAHGSRPLAADLDWVPVTDWAQSWTPDFLALAVVAPRRRLRAPRDARRDRGERARARRAARPRRGAAQGVPAARAPRCRCRRHRWSPPRAVTTAPRCACTPGSTRTSPSTACGHRGACSRRRSTWCSSRSTSTARPGATFRLDTFEFLDMDAY